MEATEAAAAQAGLTREDFARMHAGIGLAGLGRRGAEAALNKIAHPFASVIFTSDGLAACLGAHSGADGAIVVAGTGSVGVGLIDGREIRIAGYGFPVSEEGSGADIGLTSFDALRAADRPRIARASEVLGDLIMILIRQFLLRRQGPEYAAFAPIVMRHANQAIRSAAHRERGRCHWYLLDRSLRGIDRLYWWAGWRCMTPWLTPDRTLAGAYATRRRGVLLREASLTCPNEKLQEQASSSASTGWLNDMATEEVDARFAI